MGKLIAFVSEDLGTDEVGTFSEIENNLEDKRTLYSQENLKFNSLKIKLAELNDRCSEIGACFENLKKKHTFIETQTDKLQEYIAQKASNNRVSVQDLRNKHEKKLSALKHQREEVATLLERTKHDAQILIGNKGHIDQKIDDLKKKKYILQEEARHIQTQINNINSNSKDALSIYGEHVSRIVSIINRLFQEKQFSEMPRGPLGRYIEVIEARYRDAVENQLGGLIKSFVVSNNKDYKILENVLKKFPNFNPTIITTKFINKVYDVSKGKVRPPIGTKILMDQIRCSDNVVLNCLIDHGSIESILLTESKEVAEKFTSHIKNVPENLRKIILIKPGLEYCPEPSYRMYSLKIRPARFIQVDIRERIYQMELEINSSRKEIGKCESMLQELTPQLQQIVQSIKQNRSLVEKHEYSERGLCEKINELECFEYPDCNEIDLLANELEECRTKLSQIEKQLEEKTKQASDTKIQLRGTKEELTEQKVYLKTIENELSEIKNKSDDMRVTLTTFINNVRVNEDKLQEIDSTIQRFEEDKTSKVEALNDLHSEAEKLGPRIDSERSESDINEIIRKLNSKIKHRTQSNESLEDLQILIDSKSQTMTKNEELFSSVKETLDMLNDSRIKRFRFIKHLKRHMAMKVMFTFQGILSYRHFTGDISIDHDERKLTLSVSPRDHGVEGSICNTKALSGGERSFSTVAFLLSLWSCVDHPFYLLDEYDVFTDEVNREVMTLMLLSEAEAKPQRQYTFLSPQDMALESKNYIRIHSDEEFEAVQVYRFDSTAAPNENVQEITPEEINLREQEQSPRSSPSPALPGTSSAGFISLELIPPYPKVDRNTTKKKKKGKLPGKSRIYTETPEKNRLLEIEKAKELKKKEQERKQKAKDIKRALNLISDTKKETEFKKQKKTVEAETDSDDETDISLRESSCSPFNEISEGSDPDVETNNDGKHSRRKLSLVTV